MTGGTRVLSDVIVVRITSNPGETFLDRMIALVEGAERQKTPNEIALNILLAGLTIIFLLAVVTLEPFAVYSSAPQTVVCADLAAGVPDSDDHRRAAFGDRHCGHGPAGAAQCAGHVRTRGGSRGRREHAAAGQDGDHHAGQPAGVGVPDRGGRDGEELADAAQLSSLPDETPEGRSIVVLAKEQYGLRGRELAHLKVEYIPFSALTRMSGIDMEGRSIRKGAADAIAKYLKENGSVAAG